MATGTLERLVPTSPVDFGIIRAAVCGVFLVSVITTSFSSLAELPATLLRPMGVMKLLPWSFYDAVTTTTGMFVLQWLLIVTLSLSAIGCWASASTKIAAILVIFYQGLLRSFSHFNHDEMVGIYFLIVLAFTPCADAFSIDSWRRGTREARRGFRYGYPILLMMSLMAWAYFSSALLKFRGSGASYFNPENLPALAIYHSLDNLHDTEFKLAFLLPQWRAYLWLPVGLVLVWELCFPLAVFFRRLRWWILGFGVLFHLTTLLLMNIFFPHQLAMYVVFVNWSRLTEVIKRTVSRGWRGKTAFSSLPQT